jgi:hypothetical protein
LADDSAAITIRPGHGGYGYQIAALVCFVVFADKLHLCINMLKGTC